MILYVRNNYAFFIPIDDSLCKLLHFLLTRYVGDRVIDRRTDKEVAKDPAVGLGLSHADVFATVISD